MKNGLYLLPRSMTPFIFLEAFLAFPLFSSEWLLPLFRYSAEVLKPHLFWHCESAELAEQLQLYRAPRLLHRKHHHKSIICISDQNCRYCQPFCESHCSYKNYAFHSQCHREKRSGWMIPAKGRNKDEKIILVLRDTIVILNIVPLK